MSEQADAQFLDEMAQRNSLTWSDIRQCFMFTMSLAERDRLVALARRAPALTCGTCATCDHWLTNNRASEVRGGCRMGVSGSTADKASHHPYPIVRREFGCILHVVRVPGVVVLQTEKQL